MDEVSCGDSLAGSSLSNRLLFVGGEIRSIKGTCEEEVIVMILQIPVIAKSPNVWDLAEVEVVSVYIGERKVPIILCVAIQL